MDIMGGKSCTSPDRFHMTFGHLLKRDEKKCLKGYWDYWDYWDDWDDWDDVSDVSLSGLASRLTETPSNTLTIFVGQGLQ